MIIDTFACSIGILVQKLFKFFETYNDNNLQKMQNIPIRRLDFFLLTLVSC